MYETPDGITGGFRKPEAGESPGALTYVQVGNLDAEIRRLTGLGARALASGQDVPGGRSMIVLLVPGGTVQALWEQAPRS